MEILAILLSGIITENIIFKQTLGMCPFLGVSKKMNSAVGMGLSVTFVVTLSSLLCWAVYKFMLVPLDMAYMQLIIFILLIAFLVQLLDIVLKKFSPALYNSLGIYLALITTNCVILGTANRVISMTFVQTLFTSFSVGTGFLLALILMAGVRERMETANIPKFFKGFGITLIAAAIMAMAFLGFEGIVF